MTAAAEGWKQVEQDLCVFNGCWQQAKKKKNAEKYSKERIASSNQMTSGQLSHLQVRYPSEIIMHGYSSALVSSIQTYFTTEAVLLFVFLQTTMIPQKENMALDCK